MRPHSGFLVLLLCVPLTSCVLFSKLDEVERDRRSVYKQSRSLPDLEIPPDLVSASTTPDAARPPVAERPVVPAPVAEPERLEPGSEPVTAAGAPKEAADDTLSMRAPELEGMQEEAEAARSGIGAPQPGLSDDFGAVDRGHVLELDLSSMAQAWGILREFWKERGQGILELDDEQVGVQQTQWLEPEADDAVWTRYTILSEPSRSGKTELLITAEQVTGQSEGGWLPPEPNMSVGQRLAEELAAFFSKARVAAEIRRVGPERAEVNAPRLTDSNGRGVLLIPGGPSSNWESVGRALSDAGLEIEEENREVGVYKVVSAGERYQVSLSGSDGQSTEVVILDEAGVWKEGDEHTGRILTLLHAGMGG